jgi:hypothetical protein
MNKKLTLPRLLTSEFSILFYLAIFKLLLHIYCINQYGYFRDELYYIACSKNLAFGYVDQPPLSIFILAFTRFFFGDSLFAIRIFAAIAGAVTVFLTGLMVRKLGGGRFSQFLAALAVIASPVLLGNSGRYFSMNAFDILFWALACYILILIIKDNKPKLWLFFGIVIGLGLLNKYSIGFLCVGLVLGLLLTPERKQLFNKWFWLGAVISFLIFLPHILWEIKYDFPSLEFMYNASKYKNTPVTFLAFLSGQVTEAPIGSVFILIAGLYFCFFHKASKQFHFFGWTFIIIFVLMVLTNAKIYYLSPIYPIFFATGAFMLEKLLNNPVGKWIKPVLIIIVLTFGTISALFSIPILSPEGFINYAKSLGVTPRSDERSRQGLLPQHYADMFGWEEMVATVAKVYQSLNQEEQSKCYIYVRNYGEAGAIDFFGGKYNLPKASCAHNSYWYWSPVDSTGEIGIIFGESNDLKASTEDLRNYFEEVKHTATFECKYCMPYENNRPIFICRKMRGSFKTIWKHEKHFI